MKYSLYQLREDVYLGMMACPKDNADSPVENRKRDIITHFQRVLSSSFLRNAEDKNVAWNIVIESVKELFTSGYYERVCDVTDNTLFLASYRCSEVEVGQWYLREGVELLKLPRRGLAHMDIFKYESNLYLNATGGYFDLIGRKFVSVEATRYSIDDDDMNEVWQ